MMDLHVLFPKIFLSAFVFVNPAGFKVHVYKVPCFSDTRNTRSIDEGLGLWKGVPIESHFLLGLATFNGIIYLCWRLVISIDDLANGTLFGRHAGVFLYWTPCRGCWHCWRPTIGRHTSSLDISAVSLVAGRRTRKRGWFELSIIAQPRTGP